MKNPCFEQGLVIQHAPNVGAFEQSCNYPNFYKGFFVAMVTELVATLYL